MSITTRQTILLKGDIDEGYKEYRSAADNLLPGFLLQINSDGEAIANAEAGKRADVLVAIEDDFIGMTIDGVTPDTSDLGYMTDQLLRCRLCERGDVLNMILKSGQNVDEGDYLVSNGDGKLKADGGADFRMFRATEAVDATAADKRIAAEVL